MKKKNNFILVILLALVSISFLSVVYGLSELLFVAPSPDANSAVNGSSIYINISTNETSQHYVAVDFNNSLTAFWQLEAGNGTHFNDTKGRYNLSCTAGRCPIANASGKFGGAYTFNGINQTINISAVNSPNLSSNTGFAVSIWINPSETATMGIINQEHETLGQGWSLITGSGNANALRLNLNLSLWQDKSYSFFGNGWHHVFFQYNGSQSELYVDYLNRSILNVTNLKLSNYSISVGTPIFGTEWFNGSLDEIMIFNRTLTELEIGALYNASAYKYQRNFTNLIPGNYTITAYSKNLTGYLNTSIRNIVVNNYAYPQFSNILTSPVSSTYNGSGIVTFNISIQNNNGTAILNINGTNYTASNWSATDFNVTINATEGNKSYFWTSWSSNALQNLINTSITNYYFINQYSASPYFTSSSQSINIDLGEPLNVTFSGADDVSFGTYYIRYADSIILKSQPFTHEQLGSVVIGDTLYAGMGRNLTHETKDIWSYNITNSTWVKMTYSATNYPESKQSTCMVKWGDSFIIVGGASYSLGIPGNRNSVNIYNTSNNTWGTMASLLNPSEDMGCFVVNNVLYASGGVQANASNSVNYNLYDVQALNISNNTWAFKTNLTSNNFRWSGDFGASANGKYYLAPSQGFFNSTPAYGFLPNPVFNVLEYNPVADTYTSIGNYSVGVGYKEVEIINDEMFILGGVNGSITFSPYQGIQVINITSGQLRFAPGYIPFNQSGYTALASHNNSIYLTGGRTLNSSVITTNVTWNTNMLVYDPYVMDLFSIGADGILRNATSTSTLAPGNYSIEVFINDSQGYNNYTIFSVVVSNETYIPPVTSSTSYLSICTDSSTGLVNLSKSIPTMMLLLGVSFIITIVFLVLASIRKFRETGFDSSLLNDLSLVKITFIEVITLGLLIVLYMIAIGVICEV